MNCGGKMSKGGAVKKVAKAEVKKHEQRMHKMAKGGAVKVRGTGCATKGTTARGPMA